MPVCRSSHLDYRSNAYAVVVDPASTARPDAIIIDAGAPLEPLRPLLDSATVRAILITHDHHDHTEHAAEWAERYSCPVLHASQLLAGEAVHSFGDIRVQALSTPGHIDTHAALLVDSVGVFTGDVLFRGSIGGTLGCGLGGYEMIKRSLLDTLFGLDHELVVYPGHSEETTLGHEWKSNPFVQVLRGEETTFEPFTAMVSGDEARVLIQSKDYDDGTKAIVEFEPGHRAVVGGGMLQRKVSA